MPSEAFSGKEQPNTYFVQDQGNDQERQRVLVQDRMLTAGMGGVLAEQADPAGFERVIDIGCGTGGWLIDVATRYPGAKMLVGIDANRYMVRFAREQARATGVADRVEFHVMDVLRMIEFPKRTFDLVNQRQGWSYLRTWDWPQLLQEYQRVAKAGAVIRISETDVFGETNSSALAQLYALSREAFYKAGHLFSPERTGVTAALPSLMHQQSILEVQTRRVPIIWGGQAAGTEAFIEDTTLAFKNIVPFLQKWMRVPDDYQALYQQALKEIHRPDFTTTWEMVTAWGINGGN